MERQHGFSIPLIGRSMFQEKLPGNQSLKAAVIRCVCKN